MENISSAICHWHRCSISLVHQRISGKIKKTGRRKTEESDWRNYFGSCDELHEDIKKIGKEHFRREILYLCPHKKSMSYYETYEQFNRNVLMNEEYYNTNIGGTFYMSESERIYGMVLRSSNY